jgi:hypothetical protein
LNIFLDYLFTVIIYLEHTKKGASMGTFQIVEKAVRYQVPVKVALIGPSGSGKTKSALILCKGFGGKTVLVDTENKRGLAYADLYDYSYVQFDAPYNPERYVEVINYAVGQGAKNLILDSASHEWIGEGGCLELQRKITQASASKNSYVAWNTITPRHDSFINAIIRCPINLIVCLRGKDEYILSGDEGSKKAPKKVGVGAQTRDGLEYECTVTFIIDAESHFATVSKDFEGMFKDPGLITEEYGHRLASWAGSAEVRPTPAPLPKSTSAELPPPPTLPQNQSDKLSKGFVDDVLSTSTRNGSTKYGIVINQVTYGTFDKVIADIATQCKKAGPVEFTWYKDGKYTMLKSLHPIIIPPTDSQPAVVTQTNQPDAITSGNAQQENLPF